jgi:hypothetical protein
VKNYLTEGMVTVEELSQVKEITVDKIIVMIRDGFYEGRIVEGRWYVNAFELNSLNNEPNKKNSVKFWLRIPIALVLSFCIGFIFSFFKTIDISSFEGGSGIAFVYYFMIVTPLAFVVIILTSNKYCHVMYSILTAIALIYFSIFNLMK